MILLLELPGNARSGGEERRPCAHMHGLSDQPQPRPLPDRRCADGKTLARCCSHREGDGILFRSTRRARRSASRAEGAHLVQGGFFQEKKRMSLSKLHGSGIAIV
jgi:hypothetical protein